MRGDLVIIPLAANYAFPIKCQVQSTNNCRHLFWRRGLVEAHNLAAPLH